MAPLLLKCYKKILIPSSSLLPDSYLIDSVMQMLQSKKEITSRSLDKYLRLLQDSPHTIVAVQESNKILFSK